MGASLILLQETIGRRGINGNPITMKTRVLDANNSIATLA